MVAGRYRIVRLLGRGGMGEVFEADDLELGGRVALKTILPKIARNERAIERFKQEIHLARQVTHPNVCRIYDLAYHQPDEGPAILFLTMELLEGETLEQRLRRNGRMTEHEALPVIRQMAHALNAAHEAGVVHRDFKSANVLLIPTKIGLRAVITDFGLAHSDSAVESSAQGSAGGLTGTPAYVAPEQLEGGPVGPRADLYALGVVLYEVLTGSVPFLGSSRVETAMMRLERAPVAPSQLVPTLDPRWEAAILRCLQRRPADRFATALEVLDAFQPRTGGAVRRRRSMAVLGFKSLSGKAEVGWLSTALAEMLGTELSCGEQMRIISGESVARTKVELGIGEADSLSAESLLRLGKKLDVELILLGSYLALGDSGDLRLRLDLRVQETATGETLVSFAETGSEPEMLAMLDRIGRRLAEALGLKCPVGAVPTEVRAAMPRSAEAIRLYSQGLEKLRVFHPWDASVLFRKAAAADPDFTLAHSALAQALSDMGYRAQARDAAGRALELAERLSREDRYLVEGRYHEVHEEWGKAAKIYRKLYEFFPDNLDYGLRLVRTLIKGGALAEAEATIAALRSLPPPACDDPHIDLLELKLDDWRGNYQAAQLAAQRAIQKGLAQEAHLLVAEARTDEAWAWVWLGQPDRGMAAAEAALEAYTKMKVRPGLGLALSSIGGLLSVQGRHKASSDKAVEAAQIFLENADRFKAAESFGNAVFEQLLRGDLIVAGQLLDRMLELVRETDSRTLQVFSLFLQSFLRFERGELDAALALQLQQLGIHEEMGDRRSYSTTLRRVGMTYLMQGEVEKARLKLEEAVRGVRGLGLGWYVALSEFFLAQCLLEEGRASEAAELARSAICALETLGSVDYEARARSVLARALVALGKEGEAGKALDVVARRFTELDSLKARASVATVALGLRGLPEDRERVEAVLAEAGVQGAIGIALEARLALGRDLLSGERHEDGRQVLEELARDAEAHGFLLMARKARSAA